jgi:hypothetical protein
VLIPARGARVDLNSSHAAHKATLWGMFVLLLDEAADSPAIDEDSH